MGQKKQKLKNGQVVFGGWTLLGHPGIVEIMAGECFDFITVDMEHTAIDMRRFHDAALVSKATIATF